MQGTAPVFQQIALSQLAGPQASFVARWETRPQAMHGLVMQLLLTMCSHSQTGTGTKSCRQLFKLRAATVAADRSAAAGADARRLGCGVTT